MRIGSNKQVVRDHRTTLISEFLPGHEYEVVVRAVGPDGTNQALEDAVRDTIVIAGKETPPDTPSALTAIGIIEAVSLAWVNPTNHDFAGMEIWRSTTDDVTAAAKIAEIKDIKYTDNLGAASLTRYYWVKAVNTSGYKSNFYPNTTAGVSATSVGVSATSIDDFAVTATKMFNKTIILTADTWTNDSPGVGSIAWNAHSIVYNGAAYPISAGNTALAYVYWVIGSPTYGTSAAHPTLGATGFMIAINTGGTHTLVWNDSANMVIGTAYIADLAVTDAKIVTLTANKLTAGMIDASVITVTNITASNINTGTLNASVVTVSNLNASNITTGSMLARPVLSAASGARIEMFPHTNVGLRIYDAADDEVFVAYVGGAGDPGTGDVIIGDYAGDNGVKWDNSTGTFDIKGILHTDDLISGTITSKLITLAVAAGTGDVYIASGKTDFTNTDSGFILGVDDSDSDKAKLYIGDSSKFLNWDGSALTIQGDIQTASSGKRVLIDSANNRIDVVEAAGTNVVIRVDDNFTGVSTNPGILIASATGAYIRLSDDSTVGVPSSTHYTLIKDGQINVTNDNVDSTAMIFGERTANDTTAIFAAKYSGTGTGTLFQGQSGSTTVFEVQSNGVLLIKETVQITDADGGAVVAYTGSTWQTLELGGSDLDFRISNVTKMTLDSSGDLGLVSGSVIKINNTQVVGAQGAAVIDATDAASAITQLNALLVRCRTHGLIA